MGSEYVYGASEMFVQWGGAGQVINVHAGSVWFADDPFVIDRPDLFSATPPIVHSTNGRPQPERTALGAAPAKARGKRNG